MKFLKELWFWIGTGKYCSKCFE